MNLKQMFCVLLLGCFGFSAAMGAKQDLSDLLEMSEKMDQADQQDFAEAMAKADACLQQKQFACVDSHLNRASKLASSPRDRQTLVASQQALARARAQVLEDERLLALEKQRRKQEERDAEAAHEAEVNRQGLLAVLGAVGIGYATSGKSYTDAQRSDLVDAFVKDRVNASNGVQSNNFERQAAVVTQQAAETQAAKIQAIREQTARDKAARELAAQEQAAREQLARQQAARVAAQRQIAQNTAAAAPVPGKDRILPMIVDQPKITIDPISDKCPPGTAPARDANGGYMTIPPTAYCLPEKQAIVGLPARKIGYAGSNAGGLTSADNPAVLNSTFDHEPKQPAPRPTQASGGSKRAIEWGPIEKEAIAVCRQGSKSQKWSCKGPLQDLILFDEPSVESALDMVECTGGRRVAEEVTIDGAQWDVYRCGYGLTTGQRDIVKRYGLITAQRQYICPKYQGAKCTTFYDGQDKRP